MEPGPSILNMAEAMLRDEYKSSHSSLKSFATDEAGESKDEDNKEVESKDDSKGNDDGKRKEQTSSDRSKAQSDKKSEGRSVVIQVPPKRRKISTPFTPKEIVIGKFPATKMPESWNAMTALN